MRLGHFSFFCAGEANYTNAVKCRPEDGGLGPEDLYCNPNSGFYCLTWEGCCNFLRTCFLFGKV
jgi:hypothetical protein